MFRRRTSSPGKIHYRVNINKNMCLGVVDIYIDGDKYQSGFNGSYLDIYRDKKIKTISISGQISYLNPKNEYNIILGISITSILTLSPAKSLISSLLNPFHFTASITIGFFTYLFIILRFNILLSFDIPFYKIY